MIYFSRNLMDLWKMNSFFEYEPVFDEDPREILEDILKKAKKYLDKDCLNEIERAYGFAKKAHHGEKRLSGEPYIIHPVRATQFLMEINPDLFSIQACLLHDVVEDTPITSAEIKEEFGEEVAYLCDSLVKVSKIKYKGEDRQLETLKKTFIAMAQDLRVIFIKLADRIHNIQTLHYHPREEKRVKIAEETNKIFVPIAKRLGLYHFQLYLENAAFRILHEDDFNKIFNYLKKSFGTEKKYKIKGVKILTTLLKKEGITDFQIEGRLKSPWRVYEKMKHKYQSTDISNVMDLLAYRIIAHSEADCYMILGIIHKYYTPLIKKIKDYIAIPKSNGYRSIHTTVLGIFRFPTEIQIRTEEMDEVAKFGVAAHFKYSEDKKSSYVEKSQADWIKKIQQLVEQYQTTEGKEQFKNKLNIEVLDKSLFLYTPQGDVVELPTGSTVLDFAFRIHTNIGLSFKNALVNGEIKPISYVPKTGDLIQINTFKNKFSANKHWLEFLHTPSSKSQLNRYLRQQQKEEIIAKGIVHLNKKLKEYGLPKYGSTEDKMQQQLDEKQLETKIIEVMDKKTNYNQIIKSVYPKEWEAKHYVQKKPTQEQKIGASNVIVDWDKHINFKLCPECNPKPDASIIARTGKDGIKIHRIQCKAIKTISFTKLLEAHWSHLQASKYRAQIILQSLKDNKTMLSIIRLFSDLHINISQIAIEELSEDKNKISLEIEFKHPNKIAILLNDLKKQQDSVRILGRKFLD